MSMPSPLPHRPLDNAIEVRNLTRTFRKRSGWRRSSELVEAVRGISFDVPRGTVFGILGPNGAGKTTTIKMLATLLLPTTGTATIGGYDVVRSEREVRHLLGVLFGGDKGLYNQLSGFENLRYFGRLYGLDDETITRRSAGLLDKVSLADRAKERVESYSRGMKQRLHIAKTLLHDPAIAILDEPTIGLDPGAAMEIRQLIVEMVPEHTILLSTHDMHEADLLCREIAIVDRGLIVARGAPSALKAGADVDRQVVITLNALTDDDGLFPRFTSIPAVTNVSTSRGADGQPQLVLRCTETTATLDGALHVLREAGLAVRGIEIREPSLEDAFLHATGREFEEAATADESDASNDADEAAA